MLAIILMAICSFVLISIGKYKPVKVIFRNYSDNFVKVVEKIIVISNSTVSSERNVHCSYYTCFNAYKCGKRGDQQIQIYVYPMKHYVNEKQKPIISTLSEEFYTILRTIKRSKYYTADAEDACLFIPSFDTLANDNFHPHELSQALNMLP